jgi:hypothetical protein
MEKALWQQASSQNMSDVDIEILQCTTIGFIENLKNDYFKEIYQIDQKSAQQKFLTTFPCQNPCQKKQEDCLAYTNIKVP